MININIEYDIRVVWVGIGMNDEVEEEVELLVIAVRETQVCKIYPL
jgi:hypothetical protein